MQSSLLSPAESHAFQSFLSTMDYPDETLTASEWAIYNSGAPAYGAYDDPLNDAGGAANPAQREALAKATKDLMSLDPEGWNGGGAMMDDRGQPQGHDTRGQYNLQHQHQQHQQQQQDQHRFAQRQQTMHHLQQQQQQHRQHSFSSGADLFPFLHNKVSSSQELRYPMQRHQQNPHLGPSPMTASNADHGSPASPHSPFGFQQQQQHNAHSIGQQQRHVEHLHQVHIPTHSEQHQRPQQHQQRGLSPSSSSTARSTKRPSSSSRSTRPSRQSEGSNMIASTSANGGRSNGTANGTHAAATAKRARASTLPSTAPPPQDGGGGPAPKQALLSPSQKKANHIQSEQKRRANIRRGYEALCETVPALREAIREEEEAERQAARAGGGGAQRKKSRKKGARDGEERDARERLDGRAGPRSENVVLSKTIEHIQALIADRSALLARLHRARSSLLPGHPALSPLIPDPPWEREWKGGSGRLEGEDMDDEGGSEGEGDEDGE
ncbi:hypothetical protein BJ912DRAFT_614228 [Pholiota molesta]|nr:hypothetical protein BJ912DRAFT_614228 [Pholiota molesta]